MLYEDLQPWWSAGTPKEEGRVEDSVPTSWFCLLGLALTRKISSLQNFGLMEIYSGMTSVLFSQSFNFTRA